MLRQQPPQCLQKLVRQQLRRADIHRQKPRRQPVALQHGMGRQRLVQHRRAQRLRQPHVLGHPHELLRRHPFPVLVPARQRLEAADAVVRQPQLRLQRHLQLPGRNRHAQLVGQPGPPLQPPGQRGVEQHVPPPPLPLGLVERGIGMAEQRVRLPPVHRPARHPHRHRGGVAVAPQPHRAALHRQQPVQQPVQRQRVGQPRHQQRKLVAAQPGDGVAGAHDPPQPPRHHFQQRIAGGMAQPVVHRLEEVDVEQHQRAAPGPPFAQLLATFRLQPRHQHRPVEQPGQRIMLGTVPQPGLGLLQPADVGADGDDVARGRAGVAHLHPAPVRQLQHPAVVRAAMPGQIVRHPGRTHLLGRLRPDLGSIIVRRHLAADDRLHGVAQPHQLMVAGQDVLVALVGQHQPLIAVIDRKRRRNPVDHVTQQRLGAGAPCQFAARGLRRLVPRRHVRRDGDIALQLSVRISDRRDVQLHPIGPAIAVVVADLAADRPCRADRLGQRAHVLRVSLRPLQQLARLHPLHVRQRIAGQPREALVQPYRAPFGVGDDGGVGHVLHHQLQALVRLGMGMALADVREDAHHQPPPAGKRQGPPARAHPHQPPVGTQQRQLRVPALAIRHAAPHLRRHRLARVFRIEAQRRLQRRHKAFGHAMHPAGLPAPPQFAALRVEQPGPGPGHVQQLLGRAEQPRPHARKVAQSTSWPANVTQAPRPFQPAPSHADGPVARGFRSGFGCLCRPCRSVTAAMPQPHAATGAKPPLPILYCPHMGLRPFTGDTQA